MNFTAGTYAFFRRSNWTNNKHHIKHPSGTLFFLNAGYGKGKISNGQNSFNGQFNYQKLIFNTGFNIKRNYCSLSLTGQYSIIQFLTIDFNGFSSDQSNYKVFVNNILDRFEQNSFRHTFELNINIELGIRQGSFIVGFPYLFNTKKNILYHDARTPYIGFLLEIDEIVRRIKRKV